MATGNALTLILALLGIAGLVLLIRRPRAAFALLCIGALALGLVFFRATSVRTDVLGPRAVVHIGPGGTEVIVRPPVPSAAPSLGVSPAPAPRLLDDFIVRSGTAVWSDGRWSVEPNAEPTWVDDGALSLKVAVSAWTDNCDGLPPPDTPEHRRYQEVLRARAMDEATERLAAYLEKVGARAPAELQKVQTSVRRLAASGELRDVARRLCDRYAGHFADGPQRTCRAVQQDGRQFEAAADCYALNVTIPRDRLRDALPREKRHDERQRARQAGASGLMAFGLLGLAYVVLKAATRRHRARQS